MAIVVQYWNERKQDLSVGLLELLQCTDATAEGLSKKVLEVLKQSGIDPKQMVGFCADTCNVMFGRNKSVSTILKKANPNLVTVKCSCHSIHLCSSRAADQLPVQLEDLVHLVFNHFSSSPKRRAEYEDFQDMFDVKKHIILSPGQTRWLSLEYSVLRLLEQYNALVAYFTLEAFEEQQKEMAKRKKTMPIETENSGTAPPAPILQTSCTFILLLLKDPLTKPYLEFLAYALKKFNICNKTFQAEIPLFHDQQRMLLKTVVDFSANFMDACYVRETEPKSKINPTLTSKFKKLENIYAGTFKIELLSE